MLNTKILPRLDLIDFRSVQKRGGCKPFWKDGSTFKLAAAFLGKFVLVSQIVTNVYILAPFIDFNMFDTILANDQFVLCDVVAMRVPSEATIF